MNGRVPRADKLRRRKHKPAQMLQVIYIIDLRLDVRIACDGLQQKFQHAEYFTCHPLISQPNFI